MPRAPLLAEMNKKLVTSEQNKAEQSSLPLQKTNTGSEKSEKWKVGKPSFLFGMANFQGGHRGGPCWL